MTLFERPVLIIDPGIHTALSNSAAADAEGRFLVTGSFDKTVRIWSASDGILLRTIRIPAGPGRIGEIYAVAMSPDGSIVAAGRGGRHRSRCDLLVRSENGQNDQTDRRLARFWN
jgi:WD40 repeat protein